MATPHDIHQSLARVHDFPSLINDLLVETLSWPIEERIEDPQKITFGWSAEELRAQGVEERLLDGEVRQVRPFRTGQPWGIFLVEFTHERVYRTALRQVLRGLVPNRRRQPHLEAWKHDHLLFICCTKKYEQFTFAHFRGETAHAAKLITFSWEQDQPYRRTVCEHNLPALVWPDDDGKDASAWLKAWSKAFDVEAVTKLFFADYAEVFTAVEGSNKGVPEGEARRQFTQRLFNRLMFLYFIQRKGWLKFEGNKNYLRALFNKAVAAKEDFLNDRLYWTFFQGLNTPDEEKREHSHPQYVERRGEVPFLNGGLFDIEDKYDFKDEVHIPNEAFGRILDLFERYNFTVTESTPLDIEVAVDPEMLGKVFEELVTGRHESGSYYTPRPVVAFMCRESLKHYLAPVVPEPAALAAFVDESNPAGLADSEAVLNALRAVKVCDPACGSGAYLLGMMQELLRLRQALFARSGLDSQTAYARKLDIIQNNLYGVDIDVFAVNIAKLRLWLSLVVDFQGGKPPPLPNLDFKIECGDSLTSPDPQKIGDLYRHALVGQADKLAELKDEYLRTSTTKKKKLKERIAAAEAKLREKLDEHCPDNSIDWRVAFAEVFKNGGFDIALENPPYVRQELFKEAKPTLKTNFPKVFVSSADLYVYFFARTFEILRPGGTACVISSNKWLKASYGETLRGFLAKSVWVESVVDFGHAKQIFQNADVFPSITFFRKPLADLPPPTPRACVIRREELRLDDLTRQVKTEEFAVARNRLGKDVWSLEPKGVIALLEKIRQAGVPLKDYCKVEALSGIKTGLNEAFLVDTPSKDRLVAEHPKSRNLFKPYLRGQDVNRWHPEWAGLWMLALKSSGNHSWPWTGTGKRAESVFKATYPAVHAHLNQYREALIERQDQGEHWWELRACAYWKEFERPKIIYPEITWRTEWCFDKQSLYINNTVYILPTTDVWPLCVANSPLVWWYAWRAAVHCKDEGLRFIKEFVQDLPIPPPTDHQRKNADDAVARLVAVTQERINGRRTAMDELCADFDIAKPSQKLQDAASLDEDAFVAEVQKVRGRRHPLTVAGEKALKDQHARSIVPLQTLAAEARQLERQVADLVNAAYGLTPEEIALMWQTAPPRMPGEAPAGSGPEE